MKSLQTPWSKAVDTIFINYRDKKPHYRELSNFLSQHQAVGDMGIN